MITHKWFPAHHTTGMSKMSQSNKRQILATPKEYKMEGFELDQLAMETKANGSSFPLLLKNSKHIIDRVVSTYAVEGNIAYKDDYISEAYIAIYKCLEKYDSTLGAFATYATGAIRQEILYFMRNEQSMIKLGTTKLDEIKRLDKAINTMKEQGVEMSRENMREYSGITSDKTLSTVIQAKKVKNCISLDAPSNEDQECSLMDIIPTGNNTEDEILKKEEIYLLEKSIQSLSEDERFLITKTYGLFGNKKLSAKEIAKELNISDTTISYRKKIIENKLYTLMESWAS